MKRETVAAEKKMLEFYGANEPLPKSENTLQWKKRLQQAKRAREAERDQSETERSDSPPPTCSNIPADLIGGAPVISAELHSHNHTNTSSSPHTVTEDATASVSTATSKQDKDSSITDKPAAKKKKK